MIKKKKGEKKMNKLNEKRSVPGRAYTMIASMAIVVMACTSRVFANSPTPGEDIGKWLVDQVFWIALALVAIGLTVLLYKRAFTTAIITAVIAAIVLFIIQSPDRLVGIGGALFGIIQ